MKKITSFLSGSLFNLLFLSTVAQGQITPDQTLPNSSFVNENGNLLLIEGGTERGNNLFHSFTEFSLPTGQIAFFNNDILIQNIFSRVTGNSISHLDGIIKANGLANLFFLNPNGIIFGPNARLAIGGSFIATTANSIIFDNGYRFSATDPNSSFPVTINVPIGLDFSPETNLAGIIEGFGTGHSFAGLEQPQFGGTQFLKGLNVASGKTLAFIGREINFNGFVATAGQVVFDVSSQQLNPSISGNLEIASIKEGLIGLDFNNLSEINFNYNQVLSFGNVTLAQKSLLDVSGLNGGNLQIRAKDLTVTDASLLMNSNYGDQMSSVGSININLTGHLNLVGVTGFNTDNTAENTTIRGIISQNFAEANSPNIFLNAQNIILSDTAGILTLAIGAGKSGDIFITAKESLIVGKRSPFEPFAVGSQIITQSSSTMFTGGGQGGNIYIQSPQVILKDGGSIQTVTYGLNPSGNIEIKTNDISISGFVPADMGFYPTSLGTVTRGLGKSGNTVISTDRLTVTNGARINSTSLGAGNGGDIIINANQGVLIEDTIYSGQDSSKIIASANQLNELFYEVFKLPRNLTGNSGRIFLNTPNLQLADGGKITVQNDGTGAAGIIDITSENLTLINSASIDASTVSGEGGTILIDSKFIHLNSSAITTTAGGLGNGGDISLTTDSLILSNNSGIQANAFAGRGGNIDIETKGFFLSSNSQITASSELGIEGAITINNFPFQIQGEQAQLPTPLSLSEIAAQSCIAYKSQTYKVTIRGQGTNQGDLSSPRGYNFFDLIPQGQVVAAENTSSGVRLLNCDQYWEKLQQQDQTPGVP
ncbi:filamentous hemagglutinin family outer membrane protein (plasmid) [Gloeothece citriformis PCC 7424]|uniref:Filamentous hemagglutinin family outer membrane protein n=1 Tax=Gloeothece citriformis (strain PCC 7424) TaxID=65393 RepID=B7KLP4_GLOC7|nr:filamentous hemagglutinin N-terminal domain-containing protein [Gloeothece citriformis]ACK73716.1 filamentous hemagglutinin family outer membrane protein [Gloeothece citriformis PCC 7424]